MFTVMDTDANKPVVRRNLDEIVTELWPKLLEAKGLHDVDAATVDQITQIATPELRAARDRGTPDYADRKSVV